jgi:flavorubredoxin
MAKAVAEGAQTPDGPKVELSYHIEPEELSKFDAIAIGAPTYYHQMPVDFKNLFEEIAVKGITLKGKVGATFGSYGWSGEAPGLILEILKNKFEMQTIEAPLLSKYIPDAKTLGACKDLGKRISETLMSKGLH